MADRQIVEVTLVNGRTGRFEGEALWPIPLPGDPGHQIKGVKILTVRQRPPAKRVEAAVRRASPSIFAAAAGPPAGPQPYQTSALKGPLHPGLSKARREPMPKADDTANGDKGTPGPYHCGVPMAADPGHNPPSWVCYPCGARVLCTPGTEEEEWWRLRVRTMHEQKGGDRHGQAETTPGVPSQPEEEAKGQEGEGQGQTTRVPPQEEVTMTPSAPGADPGGGPPPPPAPGPAADMGDPTTYPGRAELAAGITLPGPVEPSAAHHPYDAVARILGEDAPPDGLAL